MATVSSRWEELLETRELLVLSSSARKSLMGVEEEGGGELLAGAAGAGRRGGWSGRSLVEELQWCWRWWRWRRLERPEVWNQASRSTAIAGGAEALGGVWWKTGALVGEENDGVGQLSGTRDAHSIKGTPYWMAPEVLQSNMNKELSYDLSIDIWSLGCTIIEMFTAKHPWSGFESAAAMFKVLQESPQIPETLSADGKDFLQLCFRRNPTERPTASQLLEHRFVTHTVQHDLQGSAQSFSGMRFSDVTHGPKNTKFAFDSMMKGKFSFSGHTGI